MNLEEKKKKRKWAIISCRFCRIYRESNISDKFKGHYCRISSRWVRGDDESCPNFDLSPVFMCPKYDQVIFIENCLHRRAKKSLYGDYSYVCPKCPAGKQLFLFVNNGGIIYNIIGGEENEMELSCRDGSQ